MRYIQNQPQNYFYKTGKYQQYYNEMEENIMMKQIHEDSFISIIYSFYNTLFRQCTQGLHNMEPLGQFNIMAQGQFTLIKSNVELIQTLWEFYARNKAIGKLPFNMPSPDILLQRMEYYIILGISNSWNNDFVKDIESFMDIFVMWVYDCIRYDSPWKYASVNTPDPLGPSKPSNSLTSNNLQFQFNTDDSVKVPDTDPYLGPDLERLQRKSLRPINWNF